MVYLKNVCADNTFPNPTLKARARNISFKIASLDANFSCETFTKYLIEYKCSACEQEEWSNDTIKNLTGNTSLCEGFLDNVKPSTDYNIRVNLLDMEEKIYNSSNVLNITTDCIDMNVSKVTEGVNNITIQFNMTNDEENASCLLNNYNVTVQPGMDLTYDSHNESLSILVTPLEPYTNYSVTVQRTWESETKTIYNESIQTSETAPTKPFDLRNETLPQENSVTLAWSYPNKTNGIIKTFEIKKQIKETWLLYSEDHPNQCETFYASSTYYELTGLQPSTVYKVEVSAVTVAKGPPEYIRVETPLADITINHNLTITSLTDTTVTINLPQPHKYLTNMSAYFIVLSSDNDKELQNKDTKFNDANLEQELFNSAEVNHETSVIIAELKPEERNFTIGNKKELQENTTFGTGYKNLPLKYDADYSITLLVLNSQNDVQKIYVLKLPQDTLNLRDLLPVTSSRLEYLALLLLLLIPILIFLFIKNRGKIMSFIHRNIDLLDVNLPSVQREEIVMCDANEKPELKVCDSLPPPQQPLCQRVSQRVTISQLENYIRIGLSTGELERQYKLFPDGQTKPWKCGRLPQNKIKNRYRNLLAYDETRVILKKLHDDNDNSDYINASYIDGYKSNKFYIATQGPMENTIHDFWRMVWQEQVHIICMLTNIIEKNKKKCEQYWPDLGKEKSYGGVEVLTATAQIFADFTIRQLNITCKGKKRKIKHLHFTSWLDHSVPFYPQSVAMFMKKLLATSPGPGPIVVHCSAGVGRTGAVILSDICLRMAAGEGAVDILRYLQAIRDQRANMVNTLEQYKFVHLVLLECLVEEPTSYPCQDLDNIVSKLKQEGIFEAQFQHLEKLKQEEQIIKRNTVIYDLDRPDDKDRYPDIVPGLNGKVSLPRYPAEDKYSGYINAVFVDGFRLKNQFIATQLPMPNTVSDFWRMVSETSVSVIVVLNELDLQNQSLNTCQFWPDMEELLTPTAHISVKLKKQSNEPHWSLLTLQVTDDSYILSSPRIQIVYLIKVHNWYSSSILPPDIEMILELWSEIERLYKSKGPILLTCLDGATSCGLLLALAIIIEKIKLEQQCDVCHAVKIIRQHRKQFIKTQAQFEYLYHAAITYLDTFESYNNFD